MIDNTIMESKLLTCITETIVNLSEKFHYIEEESFFLYGYRVRVYAMFVRLVLLTQLVCCV